MLSSLTSTATTFALLVVVFGPLEHVFPRRRARLLRPDFFVDACFFFGQYLVFSAIAVATLSAIRNGIHARLPAAWIQGTGALPLWTQAIVAVAAGDGLVYWFHRACHRFGFLWRFHKVHHSAEHLDWLAAHREHPFDGISTQICQNLPAIFLGFPIDVLAPLIVFRGAWGLFIHSNAKVQIGPLRFLVGAPELHHWHHARVERTAHNFANLAPWLDLVFGTYFCPRDDAHFELGLNEPWPKDYLRQLVTPLVPRGSSAALEPSRLTPRRATERSSRVSNQ